MIGWIQLDALGGRAPYRTRNPLTIHDVTGSGVAKLSLVPEPYVQRNLAALAKAETLPPDRRVDVPTHMVPHNGRLAEFLMRTKAVMRA